MDKQARTELLNIVAFCILMENGKGILDKSPDYILEKFAKYCQSNNIEYLWGLDEDNRGKFNEWMIKWLRGRR